MKEGLRLRGVLTSRDRYSVQVQTYILNLSPYLVFCLPYLVFLLDRKTVCLLVVMSLSLVRIERRCRDSESERRELEER